MYVCVYVCVYVCMHAFMYVCVYVCMYVCTYARMHACMYVCMHVCLECPTSVLCRRSMCSMCSKDLRGDALEDGGDLPWILGGDFERVLCVCASLALSLHIMRRNPLVYAPIYTHTSKFTRIRANIRAYTPTYVYTHQYKHIRAIGPYLLIYSAYTRYCTR